ncbi:NAD(P)/FAD-dependent oxidoreductase [Dyadobacter sp. CY356]|uniref:phytoene desaturase family protein n=1 Tax=Dyadobacter sp. CY356 TaxID=2906442 RepID=UPI001F1E3878|nr:NAD(P)/FAD-dependent oxidoreductase [Dyadobacter sp. CY356]MCF0055319.1 NAD(P)/FAD-dependent oxidoreductase [Dyadobacter sp. CY356]
MKNTQYDAVVVGSGPNGLAAAITLQQAGLSVLLVEGRDTLGGGMRTAELTLPGYHHDVCSAVHPMAAISPFFTSIPLKEHGFTLIEPTYAAAHPFDDGTVALLKNSLEETADGLGEDRDAYLSLIKNSVRDLPKLLPDILGPFPIPRYPIALASFGLKALPPISWTANRFKTKQARGLWAGVAAHAVQPFNNIASSAIGLVMTSAAHIGGWPIVEGGSQSLANALASYFISLGGKIQTSLFVKSIDELPSSKAVLFDVGPRQLISIAGNKLGTSYISRLKKFKYGMGVFKIDWALNEPIPFTNKHASGAGTVHLGNTFEDISYSEKITTEGRHSDKPYVLLSQPSLFDKTRAPEGKHTAWAYCHVPNGSQVDMTNIIENQIERFAPGFKDTILKRSTLNTMQLQEYNPNYVGGDVVGGLQNLAQLYSRPVLSLSPYRTPAKGIYLCSASTPPGGGVHGLCGYHAAKQALKDLFGNVH